MKEQFPTWEHQLVHDGRMFQFSEYDADTDIASPKQISILPVTKSMHAVFSVSPSASCKVQIVEGVVLGTGGSVSAGTAVTGQNKNRNSAAVIGAVVKKDYLLGSSGQVAGAEIDTWLVPGAVQGALKSGSASRSVLEWELKPGTLYGFIITAIADNTVMSWSIEAYED